MSPDPVRVVGLGKRDRVPMKRFDSRPPAPGQPGSAEAAEDVVAARLARARPAFAAI